MAYGFNEDKTKANIEEIVDDVGETKVDKVEGKVLSDNDYSDTDKAIVDNATTGLANKVDKVTGKQLSTTDFTTAYRTKIDEATYNSLSPGEDAITISSNGTNYYSSSNPYTCPHDGYVSIGSEDYAGGYSQLNIKISGSSSISYRINAHATSLPLVFVKKGMKIYGTTTSGSDLKIILYWPFTTYT